MWDQKNTCGPVNQALFFTNSFPNIILSEVPVLSLPTMYKFCSSFKVNISLFIYRFLPWSIFILSNIILCINLETFSICIASILYAISKNVIFLKHLHSYLFLFLSSGFNSTCLFSCLEFRRRNRSIFLRLLSYSFNCPFLS